MEIVRTAVIGVGGRGRYFARMYDQAAHPGFELRAVCDLQPDRLELVRSARGEGISYHSDMHELLAHDDIDAVLVATQDPDHTAPTIAALGAGKHVLVEKPLCQSIDDSNRIVHAARQAKGILMIGFELREASVFSSMKQLLDEGRIGPVKIGHAFDNVSVGGNYFFHCPTMQKAFFKTLLLQKACHSLDLLNWFMNSEPVKVYAVGGRDFYGGDADPNLRCQKCERAGDCPYAIDGDRFLMDYGVTVGVDDYCVWSREMDLHDNAELCISYANGGKATFHECHFTPEYSREFWLVGPKGKMYGHFNNEGQFLIRIEYSHATERRVEEFKPVHAGGAHGGGDARLRDEFYRRIVENDPPVDALESAYYSTALAVCADESIGSGMPVVIPGVEGEAIRG